MSSTSPQPISSAPSIESLAPPLPEAKTDDTMQPAEAIPPVPVKDEPWVPVEVQRTEPLGELQAGVAAPGKISVIEAAKGDDDGESPTLFNRVMKQRSTVMPQTAHVQKDNTLAIFITLCLVVVAIACGIYFVADRETQTQDHVVPAVVTPAPVPVTAPAIDTAAVPTPVAPAQNKIASVSVPKEQGKVVPNPLFGKPVSTNKTKALPAVHTPLGSEKAHQAIQQSEAQLSQMQYIEAEYSARRATQLAPASADAWLALGRALYCQGRYTEARQVFETCIEHGTQSKAAKLAADFISTMPGQSK